MESKNIALIGLGWLGKSIYQNLLANNYNVWTTTKSPDKIKNINNNQSHFLYDVTKDILPTEILKCDIIIYTVPPLLNREIQKFTQQLSSDKKIIFISSTSVYDKNQGDVDESSPTLGKSANGLQLIETEISLKKLFPKVCIIRPGGLIGADRHPVYSLQGKTGLKMGAEYLHLVHSDDCVKAVEVIIKKDIWSETINFVSDLRIRKDSYYTEKAKSMKLNPPQFETQEIENPTRICNLKAKALLGLQFTNP